MNWNLGLPATILPDILVMLTLVFLFTFNLLGRSNPFSILFAGLGTSSQAAPAGGLSDILWIVVFTWIIAIGLGASAAAFHRQSFPQGRRPDASAYKARQRNREQIRNNNVGSGRLLARTAALYGLLLFVAWLIYGWPTPRGSFPAPEPAL